MTATDDRKFMESTSLWIRSERDAGILWEPQGLVEMRVIKYVPEPTDDLTISPRLIRKDTTRRSQRECRERVAAALHYEDALKELLKKKQSGQKIEAPRAREPAKVISLMDALRRSVDAEHGGGRGQSERRPVQRRTPKKAGRSSARQKKAG